MKLLVIQEQHFTRLPNGEVWADKQSDINFWQRYLNVFDEIVVCARMKNADSVGGKALRSDRPEVTFVGMPDFKGAGGVVKHFFAIQKALSAALKQADCVMFRAPSPISMVSYGIVKRSGKPFAVELMNNPKTHYSSQAMHKPYQPLIQKFVTNQTKRMCRRANGVAYVTENALQELYPSTARIKGGSDKKFFESFYSTIDLKKESFIKPEWSGERPETVVLVHSGEMADYRKGQDVFIEAISELKKENYNVKGVLIGDGDMRNEFETLAKKLGVFDLIEFVGWKSGFQKVQTELKKGHFFIFPSYGEGLPRSVIEAMATGLLCFGSRIDGVIELLSGELLVDEMSGKAFAKHIKIYLDDWRRACAERDKLFEKSKEYESSVLEKRRTEFYERLKSVSDE